MKCECFHTVDFIGLVAHTGKPFFQGVSPTWGLLHKDLQSVLILLNPW